MITFYDFGGAAVATPPGEIPEGLDAGISILSVGGVGAWDAGGIREIGNILYDPTDTGKEYKLTYTGYAAAADPFAVGTVFVGYAYSADGLSWTKSTTASPLVARSSEDPFLVKSGSTYYLYVEDKADNPFRNIRLFTSTDFASWTDQGDILDISSDWEGTDVSSPVVWIDGSTWHMLYEGRGSAQSGAIGHATSSDGITWTKDSANPVFVATNATYGYAGVTWADAVVPDDIIVDGDLLILSFHGRRSSGPDVWGAGIAAARDVYSFEDVLGTYLSGLGSTTDLTIMWSAQTEQWFWTDDTNIYRSDTSTPLAAAPSFSVAPVISTPDGFVGEGDVATCDGGTHNGFAPGFQWKRDGAAISGATASTYTLQVADNGAAITCTVTVVGSGGEASATSNSLGPVVTPAFSTQSLTLADTSAITLADASDITISNRTA